MANQRTTPALAEALEREGKVRIEEFADMLTEKMQRLESKAFSGIPASDVNDPPVHGAPPWRTWWSHAEQRDLDIEIEYASQTERSRVTTRKGRAWASFRRNGSRFQGLNKGGLACLAATDLEAALKLVSTFLSLPTPPRAPRPAPALPPTSRDDAARARLEELRRRHRKRPEPHRHR